MQMKAYIPAWNFQRQGGGLTWPEKRPRLASFPFTQCPGRQRLPLPSMPRLSRLECPVPTSSCVSDPSISPRLPRRIVARRILRPKLGQFQSKPKPTDPVEGECHTPKPIQRIGCHVRPMDTLSAVSREAWAANNSLPTPLLTALPAKR